MGGRTTPAANRPAGSQPTTRALAKSSTATERLSSTDLFKKHEAVIKDYKTAFDTLVTRFLVPPTEEPSLELLLAAMLTLATQKPSGETAVQSLVAFSYYAKAVFEADVGKGVAKAVAKQLEAQVSNALKETTEAARERMEGMVRDMQGQVAEARRTLDEAAASAGRLLGEVKDVVAAGAMGPPPAGASVVYGPRTFADMARLPGLPPSGIRAVARAKLRQKQVLVDGLLLQDGHGDTLTEAVLVAKADQALAMMSDDGLEVPGSARVVSALVLSNGGVVYELERAEDAQWLRGDAQAQAFQRCLGAGAQVKVRHHKVVAEFVPVAFDPDGASALAGVEEANNYSAGAIAAARWIKPPQRRQRGQRVAFLMIQFRSQKDANRAIAEGLFIAGKHVQVRRDMEEPQRCAKCHKYDPPHLAKDCEAIHETCGTCGRIDHRTAECTEVDRDKFRCINCNLVQGHAAWEKSCPTYQGALRKLRARRPEAGFRFFPQADDPYTWESVEGGETLFASEQWRQRTPRRPPQPGPSPVRSPRVSGRALLSDLVDDAFARCGSGTAPSTQA